MDADAKSALTFTPQAGASTTRFCRKTLADAVVMALVILLAGATAARAQSLPADEAAAKAALEASSRHGEYVDIKVSGRSVTIPAFVVYPERPDKAPIVIIIHEAFGLNDWIRGVADQLAAEGFIAIAVELKQDIAAGLAASRAYGLKLPAANGKSIAVYYGPSSDAASLTSPEAPVIGFGGGSIKRILDAWPTTIGALRQQIK